MRIYIPSRGRVHTTRTYLNLPPALQKIALHVVPKDELKAYLAAGFPAVSPPPAVNRIAPTRQWIVEYHLKTFGHITDKLVMLDDDLSFRAYNSALPSFCGIASDKALINGFRRLSVLLDTYAHSGIIMQLGYNRFYKKWDSSNRVWTEHTPPVKYGDVATGRVCRAIAYRASILKQHWPHTKFGVVPVQDDFHATLTLLSLGYPNAIVTEITQDQTGGSGADGGASTYRDMVYHAESVRKLHALHPEFVRIVQKETKNAWKGEPRIDVAVQWQKALKHGIAKHGLRKLRKSP